MVANLTATYYVILAIVLVTPPLMAAEETEDFHVGMVIGHVTTQLQTLNQCGQLAPKQQAAFDSLKKNYLALISRELILLESATDRIFSSPGAFRQLWEMSLSLSDIVDTQFKTASKQTLVAMCSTMAGDIVNGKFRQTPILLRPLSLAEPQSWKILKRFMKR